MRASKLHQYRVGYGKPPKESQFKPGQSGNPRGRPKSVPSLKSVISSELRRHRTIVEDGKRLRLPTEIILIKRYIDLALKGHLKPLMMILEVIEKLREERNLSAEEMSPASIEEAREEFQRLRSMSIEELTKMPWPRR